jgi:hypoxanthine phosphoribosyltransferase
MITKIRYFSCLPHLFLFKGNLLLSPRKEKAKNLTIFMENVMVKDREFTISISSEEILEAVQKLADQMNTDLDGKNPLFLCVLNGSFIFAADLLKKINIDCGITFIKMASYQGTSSTGEVKTLLGLDSEIKERVIVIVEDIVDTGNTIVALLDQLKVFGPKEIKISTLLFKPDAYQQDVIIDYKALEVTNDFLVGYGLDYDGFGRNLEHIYKIVEQ